MGEEGTGLNGAVDLKRFLQVVPDEGRHEKMRCS